MQPMPQNGAAAPAAQGKPQAGQGGATELVASIHDKMTELMDLLEGSPAIGEDDKAKLASLIQGYQGFVQGLSAPAGQSAPKPQAPVAKGPAPMEAGMASVKPAM